MEGAVCKCAKHGLKMREEGGVEGAVCKAWSEDEPSEVQKK